MRTLSSTLLAAQKATSGQPYVKVEVLDMLAGVVRPVYTRHYTGSELDFHHAATMPADGSLVRARMDSIGNVLVQRVTNPGPSSDYSGWTNLDTGSIYCNIALCSNGASVLLFFRDALDGHTIYLRESSDSGATWGSRQTVMTPPVDIVDWFAAAFSSGGTPALFFASDVPIVYVTKRISGVWSNAVSWTNTVALITGLGCAYQDDWLLTITGKDSGGNYRVWRFLYGDGGSYTAGTWSTLKEITRAQGDSNVEFHAPFLSSPDVARLSFVEKYTGSAAYQRPHLLNTLAGTSFDGNAWRDPIPFDVTTSYGLAHAAGGGNMWLTTPSGVWQGSLADALLDVSSDVVSVTMRESPEGGQVTVALRNDDGRYNTIGSGANAAIQQGSEIRVSPGYTTSAGVEVSDGPAFWTTGWEHQSQGGQGLYVLHGADGWWLLSGWRARRQFSWVAGGSSLLTILGFILERVGLSVTAPSPSATMTDHKPDFTVHPGESGATAVRRLMGMAPDLLYFRGREARLRDPQVSDPTDYAFGTDHPFHQARYSQNSLETTRVQVFGAAGMGEAFAWDQVPLLGECLLQVHDLNQDTVAKAQGHAADLVRGLDIQSTSGEVQAPPNCGQELYDVVEVTDGRAGLTSAKRRVASLELELNRGSSSRYMQRIELAAL